MVVHTCNASIWEAETGGLQVQSQLQQLSKAVSTTHTHKKIGGKSSQAWWRTLVTPVCRRLRQEDCRFKASLGNFARLSET